MSKRGDLLAIAALSAAALALFGSLIAHLILGGKQPFIDYHTHIELARTMASDPTIRSPHFLYQLLVIAAQAVVGDYVRAGAIVVMATYPILAVILFLALRPSVDEGHRGTLIAALGALALMLVTPIPLLATVDGHFYFGYVSAGSVYHNPTILLLKPLTILLFVWSAQLFIPPYRSRAGTIAMIAVAVILSALAKPSYLICLLPTLGLIAFLRLVRKEPVDWRALLLGVMLPAVLMLGWQYLHTYTAAAGTSIEFAPLVVAHYYSDWLLPKFFLSILFPLAVTILFFRSAIADVRMRLAWIGAALGAFCFYFLIERGRDLTFHGNFGWSGIITFFVLFFASLAFLLEQWRLQPREARVQWRLILSTAIFGLHTISGLLWYGLSWYRRAYW